MNKTFKNFLEEAINDIKKHSQPYYENGVYDGREDAIILAAKNYKNYILNQIVNKDSMKDVMDSFADHKEAIKKLVLEFINDEEFPFEERKEVYLKACEIDLFPVDSYYLEFDGVNWNKKDLYSDFYTDKYATFKVTQLESFADKIDDMEAAYKSFMKKGISGFINDW
jgi:hypothetical protein